MAPGAAGWQRYLSRAGLGVAVVFVLVELPFLLRPGLGSILRGLSQHAFTLGLLLLVTLPARTVSLGTLAVMWLVGLWTVTGLAYALEAPMAAAFGIEVGGWVGKLWAPLVEECLKAVTVAGFLFAAVRRGRIFGASDAMLLGFAVGWGVAFLEDAHAGFLLNSGAGWDAIAPWSWLLPVITPRNGAIAMNHALWAATSGVTIGLAFLMRPSRMRLCVGLVGPILAASNHVVLNALSGGELSFVYSTLNWVTAGGKVTIVLFLIGAGVASLVDASLARRAAALDWAYPPISSAMWRDLLRGWTSPKGLRRLWAGLRYSRLRRGINLTSWRVRSRGDLPEWDEAEYEHLGFLFASSGAHSGTDDARPDRPEAPSS